MPAFKRYPGENPMSARQRIGGNRRRSSLGMGPQPYGNRRSPNARRPMPGGRPGPMRPGRRPGLSAPPGRRIGGARRPGSGGPRTMRTPTMGGTLTGRNRNRGY